MKRFDIRSNYTLGILSLISIIGLIIVENTKSFQKQDNYDEKLKATQLMKNAEDYLKNERIKDAIFIENINDPNETGLIGQEFTNISTGRGSLPIKLSTTNPNVAAMVVEQLKKLNLEKGDVVALCATGSFPAMNLAVYSALQTLHIKPIIILSTTASTWGATYPDFTWLDMEHLLYKKEFFTFKAIAASIGGNQDIGQTLTNKGRTQAIQAINRNKLYYLNENNLTANVQKRMDMFDDYSNGKPIKAFINIGDGMASLGSGANGDAIRSGINVDFLLNNLPDKEGVAMHFFQRGIPVIHYLNLKNLFKRYNLPINPVPMPKVGEGDLFQVKKYNVVITGIVTAIIILSIIFFILYNRKTHKLGNDIIKQEKI